MIYLWLVLALIFGLAASLLFLKARVTIEYSDNKLRIKFRSGLIRISFDSDDIDRLSKRKEGRKKKTESDETTGEAGEEPHQKFFDKVDALREKYLELRTIVDIFLRCVRYKVNFSEIYVRVRYGTGDAASTGTLYGAVWALIGNVYAFLCRYFSIAFPEVDMEPDFNRVVFETEVRGIITVRPVHIIIAVLRSLRAYRNHKKSKNEN